LRAPGVRGGGEAAGDGAAETPTEPGVRAKIGDCEAAEPAGERCARGEAIGDPAGRDCAGDCGAAPGVRGGLALGEPDIASAGDRS